MIELYSYQKMALDKLRSGSVLVGGVGSGKSITAIAYFFNKVCKGNYEDLSAPLLKPMNLYIITTARKRDTLEWDAEFSRFGLATNPDYSVSGITVKVDSWNNVHKYVDVSDSFFIFDEQRVVGSGMWVKSFLKIAKKNLWILLSATPGDTWSDYIPVFIANGFYKNRTEFLRRHAVFDRFAKYPKIVRYLEVGKLENIRRRIIVEMKKPLINTRHLIDFPVDYDTDIYDIAFKKRMNPYDNEPVRDAGCLCYILRRIVNTDDSRLDALVDILIKHPKAIVFYNLDAELEKLRTITKRYSEIGTYSIKEFNGHKHEMIPKTNKWIYLVQYTAGAEGWNCIETDTIIFYSLNYSYKIMEQASGRIDRINTSFSNLYYYRLISKSSIDKAILNALKNKKAFNERAFVRT